ncbi:MAG: methyltransferase [Deltaproteobacteria bacterium]|nr:methyltransferase [Deltaproteobacteria bacterium]
MLHIFIIIMTNEDKTPLQLTRDTVYGGRLVLVQPKNGYRFSIDSLLLTRFACEGARMSLGADLGAGCGVVGLGLLAAGQTSRVVAIEVQHSLAELATQNAALNGLDLSYSVLESDLRHSPLQSGVFDLVVMNPPFWPARSGRLPENEERRIACHEMLGGIRDWIETAGRLLNPRRGRLVIVFPARRLDALLIALNTSRLSGTRLRLVHPHIDNPAELVLIEARPGNTGRLTCEPPMVLKNDDGTDTDEIASLVNGEFAGALMKRPDARK